MALIKPSLSGSHAYCTGVWISPNTFLTADHCVSNLEVKDTVVYATRADVREDDVEGMRAGVLLARDAAHDLALIQDPTTFTLTYSHLSDPVVGENVFSMGHPLGLWWSYSQGQISAVRHMALGEGEAMWWVQATAPVSPGNSGGGLFDEDGNLIGICNGVLPRGQNLNFFVHPKYMRALLQAAGIST